MYILLTLLPLLIMYMHKSVCTKKLRFVKRDRVVRICVREEPDTGKLHSSYIAMNVRGSAYDNGCVIDGMCATVAD